jgi:hypothetical protein
MTLWTAIAILPAAVVMKLVAVFLALGVALERRG